MKEKQAEIPAQEEVANAAENNTANGAIVVTKTEVIPVSDEAFTEHKDSPAFNPNDEKYLSDYGKAMKLTTCSRHEEAIPLIDELFTRYSGMPKSDASYLYFMKGFYLHHSKKDYPEALKYYNLAINSVPDIEGICYFERGKLRGELGDNAGRDADYAIFVKLMPDKADWVEGDQIGWR